MAGNYDFDLWARLIVGKFIIQTGSFPYHDFLSYAPTHLWYDHEWGSSVIFYLAQHFFAAAGLLFLQAILTFLIFFVITKVVELRGVKTTTAYNFLFYYFAFSTFSYITGGPIRCQMFSFLFFAVFIYILERARKEVGKPWETYIYLPLLMIIWNNLHGGCVSGIGLIIIYIIGEFLNKKPVKNYVYALLATIVVLPINPWGFGYLKFLFTANTMQRSLVTEWSGIFSKYMGFFQYFQFKLFVLILLLTEFALIIKQLKQKTFYFDKTKFLVLAITLYFGIQHIKLIPLAVISLTCFLYDDFYTVFNSLTKNIFNRNSTIKDPIIYFIIIIFSLSTIYTRGFGPYLDWSRFPVKAVEFIKINNIKGKLFSDFTFGSYISYKLYPQNKVFMDGRYEEVYDVKLLPISAYFQTGFKGWEKFLNIYPPDIILLEKVQPVYRLLEKDNSWKAVFEDKSFIVFVKSDTVRKYKKPSNDINYYKKNLFNTNIDFGDKKWLKN